MKSNLTFDFAVDKATQTIRVKKELAASATTVWDLFTKPELLDQWWAPKPYQAKTKSMEFKVGGNWLYAMHGPEGDEHWALANFKSITPKINFKYMDGFCDKEGKINRKMPCAAWDLNFISKGKSTLVDIVIQCNSKSDLEKLIEMGFKEGFSIALEGLDEILLTPKK